MSRVKELGSISSGTLRNEDLIPAFNERLEEITGGCPLTEEVGETLACGMGDSYFEGGEAFKHLHELIDALGNYAPPYTYFGTHEGDGADFGFWISHDQIAEDRQSGELKSGDSCPEQGSDGELFLTVSDQGNLELYQWTENKDTRTMGWQSVWSCV